MGRALWLLAAVAVAVIVVVGLQQTGGSASEGPVPREEPFDLRAGLEALEGAPAPLAALHAQSAELLGGGPKAVRARLRELRGHPVVVNKWASWCGPCRLEFPYFQTLSVQRGKAVAFVGLNSGDATGAASEFLGEFPVAYPSYADPDEEIARELGVPANYPITLFIDERGETAFIRQGGYADAAQLAADIDRYLGSS